MRLRAIALAGAFLASSGNAEQPVRSLAEIRQQDVVMQRWDNSCGAAALATVLMHALNDQVSEKSIARAMLRQTDPLRVRVRGGFSLLDMKRLAESRGYAAAGYRGMSLEELLRMAPVIVPIEEYGNPHFVVVRGGRAGEVDVADPAFGNRRISVEDFQEVWKHGIGFVVTRARS